MKIEELRIGNKIIVTSMDFDGNEIIDIATINTLSKGGGVTLDFEDEDEMQMFTHLEDCKPIPLTEEWLLKFSFEEDIYTCPENGFKIVDGWSLFDKENQLAIKCYDDFSFSIYNTKEVEVVIKDPKSVHQLQNLVYALTGEELKIKDNK